MTTDRIQIDHARRASSPRRGSAKPPASLAELAGWLEARGVQPVFETETAALAGAAARAPDLQPRRAARATAT